MKKIFALFAGAGLVALAHASPTVPTNTADVSYQVAKSVNAALKLANQLNWQVGDFHKIDIKMAFGGGDGTKSVTQEVPAEGAFWYVNEMSLFGQAQKTEALMRRSDGKVLKLIVNGKEETPDAGDSNIEIIEQTETSITVGAGKFDCFYIKAKVTSDGKTQELEAWINPVDVNLDGMLKIVIQSQFGPITMTLKEFGHK